MTANNKGVTREQKGVTAMKLPTKIAVRAAIAATLVSMMAFPASAFYLGYGNGDPGGWDFWQEQNGGKPLPAEDEVVKKARQGIYYNMRTGHYEYSRRYAYGYGGPHRGYLRAHRGGYGGY